MPRVKLLRRREGSTNLVRHDVCELIRWTLKASNIVAGGKAKRRPRIDHHPTPTLEGVGIKSSPLTGGVAPGYYISRLRREDIGSRYNSSHSRNSRNSSTVGKAARPPNDRHFNAATALPSFMHVSRSSPFSMP